VRVMLKLVCITCGVTILETRCTTVVAFCALSCYLMFIFVNLCVLFYSMCFAV
jgi:hypothetical protein